MASRALAFSDPHVIELATTAFVPVAENCTYLQRQQDAEGEFFRQVAEQGHYGGRTDPTDTRQGIYACAADGTFLASVNTRAAEKMLDMMRRALDAWEARRSTAQAPSAQPSPASPNGRGASEPIPALFEADPRYVRQSPPGGISLKVYSRDLPRPRGESAGAERDDWRLRAWNLDHAWLTADEVRSLIPSDPAAGKSYPVPWPIVRRLARFHLIDNVRGEVSMWREEDVKEAVLTATVERVDGARIAVRLAGRVLNKARGAWSIEGNGPAVGTERGYDAQLLGYAAFDRERAVVERFDLVAIGSRWGATQYNVRGDDLGPAPLGIAFELAAGVAADRTPPQGSGWDYFGAARAS